MTTIEGKNYLTIEEVMQGLEVPRVTVYKYISQEKFEIINLKGKIYITEESYNKVFTSKDIKAVSKR